MIIAKIAKNYNRYSYFLLRFFDFFYFLFLNTVVWLLFFVVLLE